MRRSPGDQRLDLSGVDRTGGIARQGGGRGAERVREQQPCFEARIVDAGFAQVRGGMIECFERGDGGADRVLGQAAGLAARFAWARSNRRFRALASTVRRALGVPSR